ncbi:MAG: HIT family protein [Spirochaetes bacterium]|mgnify:FL=1|jgi:histidine triad (HIT) family protein|nr:HIT family protein [Spirochaetota bacterium]
MSEAKCVFCEIAAGRAPAHIVHQNDLSLAILDIHPYTKGHCLVIPRRHVPWWHELTAEENRSLFDLAREVGEKMMKALKPEFVCMYARGRRIPHTHIFLVPTFPGDVLDRFFNALEKFQESPAELAALKSATSMQEAARLLREA